MHRYGLCCAVLCCVFDIMLFNKEAVAAASMSCDFRKCAFSSVPWIFHSPQNNTIMREAYWYTLWLQIAIVRDHDHRISRVVCLFACSLVRSFIRFVFFSIRLSTIHLEFFESVILLCICLYDIKNAMFIIAEAAAAAIAAMSTPATMAALMTIFYTLFIDQIRSDRIRVFRKILCYLSASFYFRV